MPNEIQQLRQELEALKAEIFRNNFPGSQDFNKYSRFNVRLKVPTFTVEPTAAEVGDIVAISGVLKICTVASQTAPTFTIVGTQT